MDYFTDQTFSSQTALARGEYDGCRFQKCALANADLSGCQFSDCEFIDCDVSLAKLTKSAFRTVGFVRCKLLGLHWDDCNPFGLEVKFDGCVLDHSTFFQLNLKKTRFSHTRLHEVDFSGANLSEAVFAECELLNATFDQTDLTKADLRTARYYTIDPERNKVKRAMFSLQDVVGLLRKYDIQVEGV